MLNGKHRAKEITVIGEETMGGVSSYSEGYIGKTSIHRIEK